MQLFSASTRKIRFEERLEYWNEVVCKNLIHLACKSDITPQFQCDIDGFGTALGNISSISVSSPQTVNRPRSMIEYSDPYSVIFNFVVSGSMQVTQNGLTGLLTPGMFSVCDARYPYQINISNSVNVACFRLSTNLLGVPNSELKKILTLPSASEVGMGLLIRDNVVSLLKQRKTVQENDAELSMKSFTGMLGSFYESQLNTKKSRNGSHHKDNLIKLCKLVIKNRLLNSELTPRLIAQELRITTRYLHLLWENEHFTVSGYITHERLKYASTLLHEYTWIKEPLIDIAFASGFNSQSSFSRLFKKEFGCSPTEYRQIAIVALKSKDTV